MPGPRRLTPPTLKRATARLAAADPRLAAMVEIDGTPPLWGRRPGFATLTRMILEQQVTLSSGAAAYRRLSTALGRTTPRRVLARSHDQLRALGLTRQKARYVQEAARAVTSGALDLASLENASAERVRRELTAVTGIGRWTADVYLTMALRHADIWPRGDLALYQLLRDMHGAAASTEALDEIALRWRPYRAVAARILWHHYLCCRRRV